MNRDNIRAAIGWICIISLLTSLFTYLISAAHMTVILVSLGAGLLCAVVFIVLEPGKFFSFFSARSTRYGTNALVMVFGVLILLGVINFIAQKHPKKFDLTEDKLFSLSDQTEKVLGNLTQKVNIKAFFQKGSREKVKFEELVKRYSYKSDKLKSQIIDPYTNPGLVKRFKITQEGARIIIESGSREVRLKELTEEAFTNALIKVSKDSRKKVAFIKDHGESSIDDEQSKGYSGIAEAIKLEGYEVVNITLLQNTKLGRDIDIVILPGPQKSLFPEEVNLLKNFLEQGGKLLLMLDPMVDAGLAGLTGHVGIIPGNDMVVDQLSRIFNMGAAVPVINQYDSKHPVTRGFGFASFFPTVRSLELQGTGSNGYQLVKLASTSPTAWAETNIQNGKAQLDTEDRRGPITVAVAGTKSTKEAENKRSDEARLIVLGDSELVNNQFLSFGGNKDLFLNCINWLGKEENAISIRPKNRKSSRIFLTSVQKNFLNYSTQWIYPLLLIAFGATIYIRRRRK